MTIKVGDKLPEANLLQLGASGVSARATSEITKGRKVVLFGLPGAYTGTCSTLHVPSFMRTADAFRAKGVDEIICMATDTPHVMEAWGKATGGTGAGISFMADGGSTLTKAMGLEFSVPAIGFHDRSMRFSALVEDGVVTHLNVEENAGVCVTSAGETLLAEI
jgi:glutaredoxin/glutathione-dependent peroxiredoxin